MRKAANLRTTNINFLFHLQNTDHATIMEAASNIHHRHRSPLRLYSAFRAAPRGVATPGQMGRALHDYDLHPFLSVC